MTLTTSLQKRFVIAIAMIALIGNGILSAKTPKKFTIEGRVLDENGDGVRKAEVELFFDGGIRRGEDIVKAHALGASAACSGRCWFWGLAANGEQGVTDVLDLLNQETKDALSLIGQQKLADVGEHNLYKP